MNNQIFKFTIPDHILYDFIEQIFLFKNKNYYTLTPASFKKGTFLNILNDFCNSLKYYYHTSKHHYLTRELNYSRLMTIIRQICKHKKIPITSNIKYDKSKYNIHYYIFFDP
tara:strand:+ start:705 stop:1040 length:336 start_codon:yes stop_codon:yes gene_type:complete